MKIKLPTRLFQKLSNFVQITLDKAHSYIYNECCDSFEVSYMLLDLKRLFAKDDECIKLDAEFDFSDVEFSGVFPIKAPVRITGEILSKTGIVNLSATITAEYEADCDRCGVLSKKVHTIPVKNTIVTELANGEVSDEMLVLENMQLDLHELVLTEVVLNIPIKHLCREDCKGICQTCGKNLNEGNCSCEAETVDPRLQILKDLLDGE